MKSLKYSEIIKNQATINIGTGGNVSHGKSTVVRSITGIRTQRHHKEIEKNLTINLGYANVKIFECPKTGYLATAKSSIMEMKHPVTGDPMKLVRHLSFVDCPGHNAYQATMVSGTAVMDAALLLIAANDSVMPQQQTYEHLLALHRAGVNNILVLQNKLDLVTKAEALENFEKIRQFAEGSPIEGRPVVPISSQLNQNVEEVVKYLRHGVDEPIRKLNEPARITIVRSFDINKPNCDFEDINGGVIGGTLNQGVLFLGDWLEIRPGIRMGDGSCHPIIAKVCSLFSEKNNMEYAVPGGLIAIGLDIDPALTRNNRLVGSVGGKPGTLPPVYNEMTIKYSRLRRDVKLDKMRKGDEIVLSANSMVIKGTVVGSDKKRVQIKTASYICGDIGMAVALLRQSKGGNIGLDYCGKVESVNQFDNLYYPKEYQKIVKKLDDLKIHVEMDIEPMSTISIDYRKCLDKITFKKSGERVKFVMPDVKYENRYSTFNNFSDCCDSMDFSGKVNDKSIGLYDYIGIKTHLFNFICEELVTDCTLNGKMQIVIKGRYDGGNIMKLMRRYIDIYLKCKNCDTVGCALFKRDRLPCQYCCTCLSIHTVAK